VLKERTDVIDRFLQLRERGDVATDQLLNALYLTAFGHEQHPDTRARVLEALLRPLDARTL
jgi:hypothetical protein